MNQRTTDPEEILARLGDLARRTVQAQVDAAKQSIELGRAVLSPGADPAEVSRVWAEAVGREGARYWRDVGTLGVDVAGQLLTLGSRGVARVIADTRTAAGRGRGQRSSGGPGGSGGATADADDAEPDADRSGGGLPSSSATASSDGAIHVAVGLRGAPGESAVGTVMLANRHPRARRVVLTPRDARSQATDRGSAAALPIRVDPAGVTIPAHSERAVSVEVDLPAGVVRSAERYSGVVEVTGGVEALVDVVVDVD